MFDGKERCEGERVSLLPSPSVLPYLSLSFPSLPPHILHNSSIAIENPKVGRGGGGMKRGKKGGRKGKGGGEGCPNSLCTRPLIVARQGSPIS